MAGYGRWKITLRLRIYMGKKKILYISQEITPYLKPTALGEVCQKLPHKVQEHGIEVRTFMPKYGCINERRNQLHEVIRLSGMNLVIDDTDHPLIIKVATLQASRMQVYFIDNEDFFQHHAVSDGDCQEIALGTVCCSLFGMGDCSSPDVYEKALCRRSYYWPG